MHIDIDEYSVQTLNITNLLICLLYHQYVHCVNDALFSDYRYLNNEYINTISKSVFRYYDIALLIDKYMDQIDWDYCYGTVQNAKLNIEFKMMVQEFDSIFTGVMPRKFLELVMSKNYDESSNYKIYNYISEKYISKKIPFKIDDVITEACNYCYTAPVLIECHRSKPSELRFSIDECSNCILNPSGSYSIGYTPPSCSDDLSFDFDLWMSSKDLNFRFEVRSDQICSIPRGSLEGNRGLVNKCDNIGLVIVPGKGRYKKNDLFVLLERTEDDSLVPRVYDDWIDITEKVHVKICLTKVGYNLDLSIPLDYLQISSQEGDHFLLDLSASDCYESSNRKSTLALSVFEYEPKQFKYYAKVQVNS